MQMKNEKSFDVYVLSLLPKENKRKVVKKNIDLY